MAPQVLYRVCYGTSRPLSVQISSLTITPAILHAYSRHKVHSCDYPAIVPSSSTSCVRGTYVTGLTDTDIWHLDIFEGSDYIRTTVKINTLTQVGDETGEGNVEGEEVEVETYVWTAGEESLEECEWDFGEFIRDKLKWWAGTEHFYEGEMDTPVLGILIGKNAGGFADNVFRSR